MAFKMKGPSLYPNYGKAKKGIKVNREDTSRADGRATSSPFQVDEEEKKEEEKLNQYGETPAEYKKHMEEMGLRKPDEPVKTTLNVKKGSTADKKSKKITTPNKMHTGAKHKATATHFADGTKKSKRDKFNDEENRREELLNQGFTQTDADAMIDSGATTGRVTPKKGDYKKYSDLEKHDDDRPVNTKKKTKKKTKK